MLVELMSNWFAPGDKWNKDKLQEISGRRYKKGVHNVPDELKDALPKGTKFLDKKPEPKPEPPAPDLKSFDLLRADGDLTTAKYEDAEAAALKKKRQANMAKARQAKKDKLGSE